MAKRYVKIGLGVVLCFVAIAGVIELAAYFSYESSDDAGDDLAIYNQLQDDVGTSVDPVASEQNPRNGKSSSTPDQQAVTSTNSTNSPTTSSRTQANQASTTEPSADQSSDTIDNSQSQQLRTMMVAGGCFWCAEADMEKAPGVKAVLSGYSGGDTESPTYENYAEGGHREVVQVIYDANKVSYEGLLYYFLKHIDPTDGQGQFVDRGKQYSPAIYYASQEQKQIAEAVLADIASRDVFEEKLSVPVLSQQKFWLAEDYHQDFYKKSVVRYQSYRQASGRDQFIETHWGQEFADQIPEKAQVTNDSAE